ncbi:MAG: C40 family peptidase [Firmicutes bacterium]|nr:C40 family peptidase [Bacillota bacterium]
MGVDATNLTDALQELNPDALKADKPQNSAVVTITTPAVVVAEPDNPSNNADTKNTQTKKESNSKPLVVAEANNSSASKAPVSTPTPSRAASGSSSGVLATAKKYMGVRYVYGGESPSGFDCSGFTQYVFDKSGVDLPRTASDQASVGVKVSRSELAPGDLVFFHTGGSSSINHVGIYAGSNQFIHASRTKGITLTSMDDSYYKNILSTSRRVAR